MAPTIVDNRPFCPDCGSRMRFVAGFSMTPPPWNDAHWSCDGCPYRSLERP